MVSPDRFALVGIVAKIASRHLGNFCSLASRHQHSVPNVVQIENRATIHVKVNVCGRDPQQSLYKGRIHKNIAARGSCFFGADAWALVGAFRRDDGTFFKVHYFSRSPKISPHRNISR
ncbi:MAG: hypothetical protein DMG69_13310 [Acidobacteria bacterium]|nr:MAG: hypothetical protein DMG69_13310 [Acidobacteriota bacterium]